MTVVWDEDGNILPESDPRMQRALRFEVPGEPVAKERPRRGAAGNFYTPRKTIDAENMIGWTARVAGAKPGEHDVRVTIVFHASKHRLDLDNLIKTVLDGLNGVAWKDDSQVVDLHALKVVGEEPPCTIVSVYET